MSSLPVDAVLPRLLEALHYHPAVILVAPPGSGKTTRVPLALLQSPCFHGSRIVMLEPRRLAASNAARWMAGRLGEAVGETVGFQVRFEKMLSAATRIEVVTEGILARRLHADPSLPGVGVVIFDEFHERSLQADLALALCRDVQLGLREDLKILVMSATLDPEDRLVLDVNRLNNSKRVEPDAESSRSVSASRQTPAAAAFSMSVRKVGAELASSSPESTILATPRSMLIVDMKGICSLL